MNTPDKITGKMYSTDYTESDILDCVTSFKVLTGKDQPSTIFTRIDKMKELQWLSDFGINIRPASIQLGTILLV
jgi:hypothetical protein